MALRHASTGNLRCGMPRPRDALWPHRQAQQLRWEPRLYWQPGNFAGFVGHNEAVKYSLQIVADAYVSEKYQVFQVSFDGLWNPVAAQMKMHLTIDEVPG